MKKHFKLKKSLISSALAAVVVFTLFLSETPVQALTSAELAEKREEIGEKMDAISDSLSGLQDNAGELQDQMSDVLDKLEENQGETKAVIDQKYDLDQQAEILRQQVENTNQQIQEYNRLIAAQQTELEYAQEQEKIQQEKYALRIRSMEEDGKTTYLQVLFQATGLSDLLDRIDMISEIAEGDQLALQQLEEASAQVAEAKSALEEQKAALEDAKTQLAQQEAQLDSQREEANQLISSLGFEAEGYKDEYSIYEAEEQELQQEILKVVQKYEAIQSEYNEALAEEKEALAREEAERRAAEAAKASSKISSTSSDAEYYSTYSTSAVKESGFLEPLSSYVVTCAFGPRIHPITGSYGNHTGVDLAANSGTPIYATKSGTVVTAAVSTAYGNYVVVCHGSGQASLYAHMSSMAVCSGDYVAQGQVIGYVGSTGWSTGPHLHFEIIINGEYVNPMNYIG